MAESSISQDTGAQNSRIVALGNNKQQQQDAESGLRSDGVRFSRPCFGVVVSVFWAARLRSPPFPGLVDC